MLDFDENNKGFRVAKNAFTLIESLVVVVAIISILEAILFLEFGAYFLWVITGLGA